MTQFTTLHIDKEAHKFSAAHFTVFSATERERLHGHNYSVSARFVAPQGANGFSADYNLYKNRLAAQCDELDEYMLLPGNSPYLTIEEVDKSYLAKFADDEMLFLAKDAKVLPVRNVTVEELAHYLLAKLVQASEGEGMREIELCVSSGPGQKACSLWRSE